MTLEQSNTLWGTEIIKLKDFCDRYRFYSNALIFTDICILSSITALMYRNNVSYQSFVLAILLFVFVFNFIYNKVLNPIKWQSYKFYLRLRKSTLKEVHYNIDADKFYSILYCTGIKHLKPNKDINTYKDALISACWEDNYYAKKVMKFLSKYEDTNGDFVCYIVTKGKRSYFIDYKTLEEG